MADINIPQSCVLREMLDDENIFHLTFNESNFRNFIMCITDNNTSSLPSASNVEYQIKRDILLYVAPILLLVGTMGNGLAFFILIGIKSKASMYVFLATLAVMDLAVLYIGLCRLWMSQLTGFDIKDVSDVLCKIVMFIGYVCSYSSAWLIVAVTVERFIAVRKPMKVSLAHKFVPAKYIIPLIIGMACMVNLHFFWTVSLNFINGRIQCSASFHSVFWIDRIWSWIDAVLYSLSPFVIIIILNTAMIVEVCKSKHERRVLRISNKRTEREKNGKLPLMLLTVSFSFLLTTLPLNIVLISSRFWDTSDEKLKKTFMYILVKNITELIMYVNHSVNIFLYSATGTKFRAHLKYIFRR